MTDKNTPGPWTMRCRYSNGGVVRDCFVMAPDVHGFAYSAEVLGDDEYREETGMERRLADCRLIAAAIPMREALRAILRSRDPEYMRGLARAALAELDKVPT